jgi:hypothetical protein
MLQNNTIAACFFPEPNNGGRYWKRASGGYTYLVIEMAAVEKKLSPQF